LTDEPKPKSQELESNLRATSCVSFQYIGVLGSFYAKFT
jgi:hypothetical protein